MGDPEITWTEEAKKSIERAPVFLRGMVKKLAEKKAREQGIATITPEHLARWKNEAMGGLGGEQGLREAAELMQKGHLPWTLAARERLATVPEFMRGMVRQIAEEIAQERGHLEVNVELIETIEALGATDDTKPRPASFGAASRRRPSGGREKRGPA